MQITITFQNSDINMDFQLNAEMIIKDALRIISENSNLSIDLESEYVYSKRNQKKIPVTYAFYEAEVYSGDILMLEERADGKQKNRSKEIKFKGK